MPLFLDLHKIQSKAKDRLKAIPEEKFWIGKNGCRCVSCWKDFQKNLVVSLFDAPGENDLKRYLSGKPGINAHDIIPVNSKVAEVFLERLQQKNAVPGREKLRFRELKNEVDFKVYIVLFTDDPILLRHRLGDKDFYDFCTNFLKNSEHKISKLQGKEILSQHNFCVASFFSVYNALNCAAKIKKRCLPYQNKARIKLVMIPSTITLGDPCNPFFNFYFYKGATGKIVVSSRIHKICGSTLERFGVKKSDFTFLPASEEKLLKSLMKVLNQNWQNPNFDCREFCSKVALSKASLYRKCTATTGRSPNNLLREYRLLQALRLLKSGQSITRTGYDTGFNSPSYFSRCFQQQFKIKPVVYRKLCESTL